MCMCPHRWPASWKPWPVQPGQNVAKGAPLFTLDSESERAAQAEANARVDSSRAQAANTDKGRRAEEVAVTQAQYNQAQAAATLARNELARQQQLVSQGFVSKARVEDATTALNQAQAHVAELGAALQVARLPARVDERSAAQASADAAVASLQQTQWRTAQKQQTAPAAAVVAETFFRAGELVPAGQPVVSLLPPENMKARFFVPEAQIGSVAVGQVVQLLCDGCGTPIAAHISRIATQPEYTPRLSIRTRNAPSWCSWWRHAPTPPTLPAFGRASRWMCARHRYHSPLPESSRERHP